MTERHIAVIGASGVVGRALMEHLTESGEKVVGLSRREPADLATNYRHLDLMSADACRHSAKSELSKTTHLVYTALFEKPGLIAGWHEADQMKINLNMLQNILEPLKSSKALRHITLLQGTKAYGAHVEPMRIPGLEREPRHAHENFYWLQQDYLNNFCEETNRKMTIWRPQIIFGHALNAPMNMLNAIGIYAAILKARGQPLVYPGGPAAITEAVDADLLAQAIQFSFDNPSFDGETFNITNGDVFRWQDIWQELSNIFDMQGETKSPQRLSDWIYDCEAEWQNIIEANSLRPYSIRELAGDSFFYADALFNAHSDTAPPPSLLSTIKLRQTGFNKCIDTLDMFKKWFNKLRLLKVLPA